MSLRLVTAEMRLSSAIAKTTMCILGPSGSGKTYLMKGLPGRDTLCLDFEAGLMSVQDWDGDSIPIRSFEDARDMACLIGGVNPAADPAGYYSEGHHAHVAKSYPDLGESYAWTAMPTETGGNLSFKGGSEFTLSRTKSTIANPGRWQRLP